MKKLSIQEELTTDSEILRRAIIAEYDTVNLYEQLALKAKDPAVKTILMDVNKEEKTHVGEFQALLLKIDEQQISELQHGKQEVDEKT